MPYFTAVSRPANSKFWGIQFGDKDKATVEEEVKDLKRLDRNTNVKFDYKILKTRTMRQTEVNAAVEALNAKG